MTRSDARMNCNEDMITANSETSTMSSVIYLDNNATTQIDPEFFDGAQRPNRELRVSIPFQANFLLHLSFVRVA
jgi:hypothetical protein